MDPKLLLEKGVVAKDAVEKDVAAKEIVLYEHFVEALRADWGVEPSDQTRDLFEKLSSEPDQSHHPTVWL